ncbi:TM6S2 protein, partial [Ibidorhyncha struthersii]|nr:TM6S2 protein [Ibidorhyncha struthersii]
MQLPAVPGALAPSLLAIPVAFGINSATSLADSPLALMLTGVLVLAGLISIIFFVSGGSHFQDPLFCVFVVLSFTSVVDLIISLEEDGYISGFMEVYVREGEPYLRTAHGIMICYWDGIVHYGLYLAMMAAIGQRKSYRNLGLFWLGSLMMSILVFLLGNMIGTGVRRGARLCQLLGDGGDIQPLLDALGALLRNTLWCRVGCTGTNPSLPCASPSSPSPCHPLPCVPQAQFSHLGSSLHARTPFPYQTPEDVWWSFILTNVLYALGPQLLAYRCLRCPAFFLPPTPARSKKHQ